MLRERTRPDDIVPDLRLLESPGVVPDVALHQLYTKAVQSGRRDDVMEMVSATVPGATGVEILTEGDTPVLHILLRHYTVPVALAGDGVHALFRLILELASSPKGLVLLEEPECHQHPGNIRLAARSILAATRRAIQVILTTHSLELIDILLAECSTDDLSRLSVHRLNLRNGKLLLHRLAGPDVAVARQQIEDDLR
jgi:predicted ATPase